ncbi:hypothetical protein [Patulibacter minatonensis]|uniref:hypothetical protein n=1 Tax=Patulibacter minatonensis TaxID=298163 RepID=UPI00047C1DB1|nr:hypothetical protein [Patulibacter minatonensis]
MHAPTADEHHTLTELRLPRGARPDSDELRRARAAVVSIERVRAQLAETQRSLEAFIARSAVEADRRRAAGPGVHH